MHEGTPADPDLGSYYASAAGLVEIFGLNIVIF